MTSILITGGTGSFGQAFAKHLLDHEKQFTRIAIYSRSEHKQADMSAKFIEGDDPRLRFFIGDVRDLARLRRAFDGIDAVIHAAALKRIEVGYYNPEEMVKTNIFGSMNVIEAAKDAGVKKVIFLSSDKAWQPISPYGQSKALAETLFLNANNARGKNGPLFAVCRYGNVWGSAGSVVPKWLQILETSKSVPVTDPNCTRFYMSMQQAVNFVLDTIGLMDQSFKAGETMLRIPNLPAYRLGDLAAAMGAELDIKGLPIWEKMHEGMCEAFKSNNAKLLSVPDLKKIISETHV